ncbi:alpha/beta fold hydrolase [Salidesulfovibrio onnuriiensis]|uniref:alpha/beta fold hydrolase n=1 Tax=Salidesulfovibrio onnuriiensis TaxID=2583823 RepID=UPI00164FB4A0|nr:alpha/beta fold hydrolase [Salidesulfovibrio onnuriiensis]
MGKRCAALVLFISLLALAPACLAKGEVKPYPFTDPYKATVFGTPPEMIYHPARVGFVAEKSLTIKDRHTPDLFWYAEDLDYSMVLQDKGAPLMFLVAGTGARHNSAKMRFLAQVFYSQGYHVVCVSSPTHYNFIVSASRYAAAGYVPHDVEDLYRVMLWCKEVVEKRQPVTSISVGGYSLGGMHSAFLARLDSQRGDFKFRKVLLINPAVNLYSSALRFDSWLSPKNTGGETPNQIIDKFFRQFADFYKSRELKTLDSEVLYQLSDYLKASDADYRVLIATAFRITSSSMVFTSDVCLNAGYIVPADKVLTKYDPLLPYMNAASRIRFEDYLDEYLYPYLQFLGVEGSKEDVIRRCSLESIGEYLKGAGNIAVVGNEDDPILDEGNLNFLRDTFGDRVRLFPHGGHCGNLQHVNFVNAMLEAVK